MRLAAWLAAAALFATPALAEPTYGLSLLGKLQLPADFAHFPDANPDAPKGGTVALASVGSFDSLNPFIIRGSPAGSIMRIWDTLLASNVDEPSAMYAHLAQSVDVAADHKSVTFVLRPEAKFNDGTPVLASDVVWSFNTLREKGRPFYRSYWADVSDVQATADRTVVFHFKTDENHELPMILGQLPVLPEHWWKGRDFSAPLSDPPVGSGPYEVGTVSMGSSITYKRVANWWAANLPTGRGLNNFDTIRYEYFRDPTVAFEAFKAGQVDYRAENSAKNWATSYDFPAVEKGLVKKESLPHHLPTGMQGFAMNTRRGVFSDRRVRQAMDELFDFQWMNKNLFYGQYTRTESYFSNSEYASSGIPQGTELALLEPFRAKLPPELFTTPFTLPVTDGSGNNREGIRRAYDLLKDAGWTVKDRKLVNAAGQQMSFEILLADPAFERIGLPFTQWLGRLGIDARIRTVDAAQFQKRMDDLDFDMAETSVGESESLGNEQVDYWSCASAKQPGTQNLSGVCDPAVDSLVNAIVGAKTHEDMVTAAHALDRVLLWGWYMVPQWYLREVHVAYWNRFGHPDKPVRTGVDFAAWWVDPALAKTTDAARGH
jgi:microcin C transport system substrate-binding protein